MRISPPNLSHNNKAFSSTCTKWHKTQTKGKKNQKQSHEICPTGLIFHLDSCQLVLFFHSFSSASSSAVFFCLQMMPHYGYPWNLIIIIILQSLTNHTNFCPIPIACCTLELQPLFFLFLVELWRRRRCYIPTLLSECVCFLNHTSGQVSVNGETGLSGAHNCSWPSVINWANQTNPPQEDTIFDSSK